MAQKTSPYILFEWLKEGLETNSKEEEREELKLGKTNHGT